MRILFLLAIFATVHSTLGLNCGGLLESDAGQFSFPPEQILEPGKVCVWIVKLISRQNVQFNLTELGDGLIVSLYKEHNPSQLSIEPTRLSSSDQGISVQNPGQTLVVILTQTGSNQRFAFTWDSLASTASTDSELNTAANYINQESGHILWKRFSNRQRLTLSLNADQSQSLDVQANADFRDCSLVYHCQCSYFALYEITSDGCLRKVSVNCGRPLPLKVPNLFPNILAFVYLNSSNSLSPTDFAEIKWTVSKSQVSPTTTITTTKPPTTTITTTKSPTTTIITTKPPTTTVTTTKSPTTTITTTKPPTTTITTTKSPTTTITTTKPPTTTITTTKPPTTTFTTTTITTTKPPTTTITTTKPPTTTFTTTKSPTTTFTSTSSSTTTTTKSPATITTITSPTTTFTTIKSPTTTFTTIKSTTATVTTNKSPTTTLRTQKSTTTMKSPTTPSIITTSPTTIPSPSKSPSTFITTKYPTTISTTSESSTTLTTSTKPQITTPSISQGQTMDLNECVSQGWADYWLCSFWATLHIAVY